MTDSKTLDEMPAPGESTGNCEVSPSAAPSGERPTLGPESVREPEATTPDVGQPGPPLPALCARCGGAVPEGAGRCPACGTFQKDNVESVVHGLRSKKLAKIVDAYRVDLIEQLFRERGGREALDVVGRIAIENYALVCAQHKTIEARLDQDGLFTQTGRRRSAFDMLKGISETIDRLRAELPPPIAREPTDYSALTTEQLINRTTVILRSLLETRDAERAPLPPATHVEDIKHETAIDEPQAAPASRVEVPEWVDGYCAYCHRTCVGPEHFAFSVLHWADLIEVKKRDDAKTAEMMLMIGQPLIDRWPR